MPPTTNGYAQSTSNSMALFPAQQDKKNRKYIAEYKSMAIAEMKATGVPASINLAQAIISSKAGESEAATKNKNHCSRNLDSISVLFIYFRI